MCNFTHVDNKRSGIKALTGAWTADYNAQNRPVRFTRENADGTCPLAIQKDGTWYCYDWDLTKDIGEVFGQAGYIRTTYAHTPYGVVTEEGDFTQPLQWSSEYSDPELGLVYYNYRYYNLTDGRWIRRDPIGLKGGSNLYSFIGNKTGELSDSLGLILLFSGNYEVGLGIVYGVQVDIESENQPGCCTLYKVSLKGKIGLGASLSAGIRGKSWLTRNIIPQLQAGFSMVVAGISQQTSYSVTVCRDTLSFVREERMSISKTANYSVNILGFGFSFSYDFSLYAGVRITYVSGGSKTVNFDFIAGGYATISYSYSVEGGVFGASITGPSGGDDLFNENISEYVKPILSVDL